jgi:hypothetical protein
MELDGWHVPEAWAAGQSAESARIGGEVRVVPVSGTDFAVIAHHGYESTNGSYSGVIGIVRSHRAPQSTWDFSFTRAFLNPGIHVLDVAAEHFALFNIGASERQDSPADAWVIVHIPSMRLTAVNFYHGWTFRPRVAGTSLRFIRDRSPLGAQLVPPRVEVPLDGLCWTAYERRPRDRAETLSWLRQMLAPQDME